MTAVGADGEDGKLLVQFNAAAGRTDGRMTVARQELEVLAARTALILEKWHGSSYNGRRAASVGFPAAA